MQMNTRTRCVRTHLRALTASREASREFILGAFKCTLTSGAGVESSQFTTTTTRRFQSGASSPENPMAKPNYAFEKKQRDQAKKKKQEEKRQKKLNKAEEPAAEAGDSQTEE